MATYRQILIVALAFIAGLLLGIIGYWFFHKCDCGEVIARDTVTTITRDTIDAPVPKPSKARTISRVKIKPVLKDDKVTDGTKTHAVVDNQNAPVTIDSAGVVSIPITQREYETPDYKAYVSGYKPALDSIKIYPQVKTVTNTITKYKPPRWSLTIGPGGSYDGTKIVPSLNITAGFVLWSK